MIIVLSVPHTGTRFTCSYLDHLRVNYVHRHTEVEHINELYYRSGNFRTGKQNKAIIPVRDPLLTFVSSYIRTRDDPTEADIKPALDRVVLSYDLIMQMEDWFNFVHLRLDCDDKKLELQRIAEFCDAEFDDKFKWKPVGKLNDKVTDYNLVKLITKDWPKDIMALVERRLQIAREYYDYS